MLYAIDYIRTAAEGGQHHYRCYGGQMSLYAHDGEPPIEPLNSAAKTGLEAILLLWNVDIYLCNEDV